MDRREALKKLAAGSAVAAGASVVFTSNGVAFAASLGNTGLDGNSIPGPGDPIDIIVDDSVGGNNNDKELSITYTGMASCVGGQPDTMFEWQIVSFTNGHNKQPTTLELALNGGQTRSSAGGPTGFTTSSVVASSGVCTRADAKPMKKDSYVLQLRVNWTCTNSSASVEALFEFRVVNGDYQGQQTLEWNIISS